MKFKQSSLALLLASTLAITLTGCAGNYQAANQSADDAQLASSDSLASGDSCPVVKFSPPAGLKILPNEPLQTRAVGEPNKGGVCSGHVYLVEQPVTVYRVWSANNEKTLYGGWWSLNVPEGPRDAYRDQNNICPSWSALDRMSACEIKVGTKITIGPGQSAFCPKADMTYPTSNTLQVYIPNYYDGGQIYVDNCTNGAVWP